MVLIWPLCLTDSQWNMNKKKHNVKRVWVGFFLFYQWCVNFFLFSFKPANVNSFVYVMFMLVYACEKYFHHFFQQLKLMYARLFIVSLPSFNWNGKINSFSTWHTIFSENNTFFNSNSQNMQKKNIHGFIPKNNVAFLYVYVKKNVSFTVDDN